MMRALELIFDEVEQGAETYEDIHIHEEIGELARFIHKNIVKPISKVGSSNILRKQIIKAIGDPYQKTILDVSAGDDGLVFDLANAKAKKIIANDISHIEMKPLYQRAETYSNIEFRIGNFVNMRKKVDIVVCKNTLHHMNTIKQVQKALKALKRCSKEKIVIMDIENPRGHLLSKMWNNYYRYMLKDQGGFFITYEQFLRCLQVVFGNCRIKAKKIRTIKGTYMLAEIRKR